MRSDWADKLADTYPPTPIAFTMAVKKTVAALPARKSSWRLPLPATVAYALAMCGVAALLVFGLGPIRDTTPATAATPLIQLPLKSLEGTPKGEDGWQAVATEGSDTWYYRAKTAELALVGTDQSVTVTLDLWKEQAVKPYTFLCSGQDHWVAFTVHGNSGDAVWVVTAGGWRLKVPAGVRWVDESMNEIQVNWADAVMVPTKRQFVDEALTFYAIFPEGTIYNARVSWTGRGLAGSVPANISGSLSSGYQANNGAKKLVPSSFLLGLTKGDDGKYTLTRGDRIIMTELKSDSFRMLRICDKAQYLGVGALFIYDNDPTNTLWKLDMTDGSVEEVANRCVAAGWRDEKTCWYATKGAPTTISTKTLVDSVITQVQSMVGMDSSGSTALTAQLIIENFSDKDYTVPVSFPCELLFKQDGEVIKAVSGDFELKNSSNIMLVSGEESTTPDGTTPITLKPGDWLRADLASAPISEASEYALEGNVLGTGPTLISTKMPYWFRNYAGVNTTGAITADRRLAVSFTNNSRSTISLPCLYASEGYSTIPFVCYRLYQGDAEVKRGIIRMARTLPGRERQVEMGETRTLTEVTNQPVLAGLSAGRYRLEGFFEMNAEDYGAPWGMAGWYYFTVEFEVK